MSFFIEKVAYADNCGSLSDCYQTVASATAVGVGIAVIVIVGVLLDFLGLSGEAEAGLSERGEGQYER